jgi:hypothetical protein
MIMKILQLISCFIYMGGNTFVIMSEICPLCGY